MLKLSLVSTAAAPTPQANARSDPVPVRHRSNTPIARRPLTTVAAAC
jgi:hypothetical protein